MGVRLSQVLLNDENWIMRCLDRVHSAPFGVEWACGQGALTRGLIHKWEYTLGIELDRSFCSRLRKNFPSEQFGLVCGDITTVELPSKSEKYPLVGNLPYHLTGPLLIRILKAADRLCSFQGLIQLEVAKRLCASPGDSEYRGISCLFQTHGEVESPFEVPPGAFKPEPNVDSAWFEFYPKQSVEQLEDKLEFSRLCFKQPRKTLLNNLSSGAIRKNRWRNWMENHGWNLKRRPQTLEPDEFKELFKFWKKIEEK